MLAQFPEGAPSGPDPGKVESEVFTWGVILILLIVVGGAVIMMIRRRLRDAAANAGADAGFSLSDLRAMRDRGEITSDEYEQTRARVIAKVKGKTLTPQKAVPLPPTSTDLETEPPQIEQTPPPPMPPTETSTDENPPPPNPAV